MSVSQPEHSSNQLELARFYAKLGWSVVPVRPKEKIPSVPWAQYQREAAPDGQLQDWFSVGGFGIGLVQGAAAGTIVLDFDGEEGLATRAKLEQQHGPFPNTVEALTPGGGCHVLLRHPGRYTPTRKGLLPGFDVRGDGGFIVAHPSVHYTGRRYEWDIDHHPDDVSVAPCPAWVADLICDEALAPDAGTAMIAAVRPGMLSMPEHVISDGRETYMRNTVLAVLSDLHAELGRLPTVEQLFEASWSQYSRKVDFSRPGRGKDEVMAKCRYTLARAAAGLVSIKPKPDMGIPISEQIQPVSKPLEHDPETGEIIAFPATPLRSLDLALIPPRPWLYGRELLRGFVSVLGSPGGVGKTAFTHAVGVSVALNRPLIAHDLQKTSAFQSVHHQGAVWFYNLEDPSDELRRRMKALILHHHIDFDQIADIVFVDSGRDRPLIVTKRDERGTIVAHPVVSDLVAELLRRNIALFVVDPFVQSHTAEENRNEEMNAVMSLWSQVAHLAKCAVWLIHHFRKGGQGGDADSFRGAAAIQGAARVMSTLSTMTPDEASKLGVEPEYRRQYVRMDNAKANMAPAADKAEWYHLVNVQIGNTQDADYPDGDHVQTIEPWEPPSAWEGISWATIETILTRLKAGPSADERYAAAKQSKDRWAGHVIVEVAQKTEGQAATIIKAWIDSGVLEQGVYSSPSRKGSLTSCVSVNAQKAAEMRGLSDNA